MRGIVKVLDIHPLSGILWKADTSAAPGPLKGLVANAQRGRETSKRIVAEWLPQIPLALKIF